MTILTLAGLTFGSGLPKICIPLTGENMPALLREAQLVRDLPADLFEWRMDGFFGDLAQALPVLSRELGKPLLCTLRTLGEGGRAAMTPAQYEECLTQLLACPELSLLDIELSAGEDRVRRLVALAHGRGVGVILSHHDFAKTPPQPVMTDTLLRMKALGADLPKLAVMPRTPDDVLALLAATRAASKEIGPVITMAMGELGKLTRVSGGVFGSVLTFGAGETASAPGQLNAEDLKAILEDLTPKEGDPS